MPQTPLCLQRGTYSDAELCFGVFRWTGHVRDSGLADGRRYDVHCLYVDLGQPCEDRQAILDKAKKTGAATARIVDVRDELCRDFAFPVLAWQAKYEADLSAGYVDRPAADHQEVPGSGPRGRAPRHSPTARPAKGMTNADSSWRPTPWHPKCRSSLRGESKSFANCFQAGPR